MIRKLFLPALAATLLAGCITPYAYRPGVGGPGDYYYGRPSVEYRYYGGYYGGYGYPSYGYPYYGGYGGYPYRYGAYGYYGYPYPYYGYPRYRYPSNYHHGPYRPGGPHYRGDRRDGRDGHGPWTGVDDLRRRIDQAGQQPQMQPRSGSPVRISPVPRAANDSPRTVSPRPAPSHRPTNRDRVQTQEP